MARLRIVETWNTEGPVFEIWAMVEEVAGNARSWLASYPTWKEADEMMRQLDDALRPPPGCFRQMQW
jgi:hypothetical protein